MNAAVHEAVIANDNNSNIAVAVDGTWHKRGYSSLKRVVCAMSVENGKFSSYTSKLWVETEELIRVKSVEVQSPPVDMVWKFRKGIRGPVLKILRVRLKVSDYVRNRNFQKRI
ncbi:hypothetical protein TNCV_1269381 [Trichonephila clavipes]|nr:hypothetical protein TNCV_1269381 [Trichonephila clavipes]